MPIRTYNTQLMPLSVFSLVLVLKLSCLLVENSKRIQRPNIATAGDEKQCS